ncbi:MAG TPA: hypothetical protein VLI39_12260 [Sedimentisphaerales bacterium]|nr:hypothetical protein [Sedimentisphaerales bacterium]
MRRHRTIQIAAIVCMMALAGGLNAQETAKVSHFVPADKGLPQGFATKLVQRGEPAVWSGEELETIGMPVGGIATGQLYLRGDGTLV